MSVLACATCDAPFNGRSDAIYCSPACRQKAHRARAAGRVAAMVEELDNRAHDNHSRSPRIAACIKRSRELCERSAVIRQRAEMIQREGVEIRMAAL